MVVVFKQFYLQNDSVGETLYSLIELFKNKLDLSSNTSFLKFVIKIAVIMHK